MPGSLSSLGLLGGLTSRGPGIEDEHVVWFAADELKPGDRIVVELIETEVADPIQSRSTAQERADDERAYFEHCKNAYLEMREKYEGQS
jgi:hypothetical protein